ncbi:MAG: MotA/TolQ/ExbB proton channel family protein [Leptospirales bacterium]
MNAFEYLLRGGPIMYILLPMSAIALAVGLERLFILRKEKVQTEMVLNVLRKNVIERLDTKSVLNLLKTSYASQNFIINKILRLFVESELEGEKLEFLIEAEAILEERKLKERMWVLDTAITMAPLLGLLGTILGIVGSFHVMSISGLGKPAQITGGVAEALIATATGLVIAIVSLGFFNFLHKWITNIKSSLESAARLITILHLPIRTAYRESPEFLKTTSEAKTQGTQPAYRVEKGSSVA